MTNLNKAHLVSLSEKPKADSQEIEIVDDWLSKMAEPNAQGIFPIHKFAFEGKINKIKRNKKTQYTKETRQTMFWSSFGSSLPL